MRPRSADLRSAPARQPVGARLRARAFLRGEHGSTTIEFAIAIPVVVLLIIGSMLVMLGLFAYGNANYATEAAARYASIHGGTSDVSATAATTAAQVQSKLWLTSEAAQVSTTWPAGNLPGNPVIVTTTITLPFGIPLTSTHQLTIAAFATRVITR